MPAPTVWSDDSATGTQAWNSPDKAEVQDDDPAFTGLFSGVAHTHYLKGLNPGFTETLPPRQVIATVRHGSQATGASRVIDHTIKLVVDGVVTGTNKATATTWTGVFEDVTYTWDIPADLSLTAAQVNASDFGIVIAAQPNTPTSSVRPRVDFVNLEVVPALRHLTCTDHLGNWQLGQKVPLALCTKDGADAPTVPDASPYADIYDSTATLVESIQLPAMDPAKRTGVFGLAVPLDQKYTAGTHFVVYRYLLSTVKWQRFAHFTIKAGGNNRGAPIALHEYVKPEARYILNVPEVAGLLRYIRNPAV